MSLLSPPLQAFVAIAKYKTVHGAASAIHLTQTAVTQRIRALEAKLHTTLFTRTRRGMVLTPEGEALLHYCQAAHELEGEALAKIKGAAIETTIQIAITGPSSVMRARIIPSCIPVMKEFPQLLMQFNIDDTTERHKSLRVGNSQFAIIQREDVALEMESKLLQPEHYVLVCTSAWKKRKLKEIIQSERIVDFDPADQLTFNYLKHFDLFDFMQHDRHFANRTESIVALLVAGCGYGLLTTEFSKPYVEREELIILNAGKIYQNKIALAWYTRPEPPTYFSALINAIT